MKAKKEALHDDMNPDFIFALTNNVLLAKAVNGEIDLLQIAKAELASRGLGSSCEWIGFEAAKKLWNVK